MSRRPRPARVPLPLATPEEACPELDRAVAFELGVLSGIAQSAPRDQCSCRRPSVGTWPSGLSEAQLLDDASPAPACSRCGGLPPVPWSRMPNAASSCGLVAVSKAIGARVKMQERPTDDGYQEVRIVIDRPADAAPGTRFGDDRRVARRNLLRLNVGVEAVAAERGAAVARCVVAACRTVRAGLLRRPSAPPRRDPGNRLPPEGPVSP